VSAFAFRLQKVYEYREMLEDEAKNFYRERQAIRVEAEQSLDKVFQSRTDLVHERADDLSARLYMEVRLQKLDDHERACRLLIKHLEDEEEKARLIWLEKKQDTGVLENLRDKAREEWQHTEDLKEQQALDEWATQRRKTVR
jgi:flagellar export protein FliJ